MLTHKTQTNLSDAEAYFQEHLQAGDYYSQNHEVMGMWRGAGAEMLGLSGPVRSAEFLKLCHNQHPVTGERLTQRHKTTRTENGREVANRRVFFDFTFSPPKSVSLMGLLAGDSRIIESHDQAVRVALAELEQFAATRVHAGLNISDRLTGNVVAATFRHDTSRALDPHLHTHCVLFNATFDPVESRWKAMDNFELLRARKYAENVYYHELAKDLLRFGYSITNHPRGDFELQGVSPELCKRFSKRHQEIDKALADYQASGALIGNEKAIREALSLDKRARKIKGVQPAQLHQVWNRQLSQEEKANLAAVKADYPSLKTRETGWCGRALVWAEEHLFNRNSVVQERELWRHALEHGRGMPMTVNELKAWTANREYVRNPEKPGKITTKEVLEREQAIIAIATKGIRRYRPFAKNAKLPANLAEDQRKAVEKILNSRDFVTLFRGGAGTGKSFALQAVNNGLVKAGHSVVVVAPQRQQALDLAKDGFALTQTVSEFLTRREMPERAVVLVDEAGQIGARQMLELLSLIQSHKGRVIFSGDTRQYGAVEASDALRAIEKYSGIVPAELTQIRRQNPKLGKTPGQQSWIKAYRTAIEEAQTGDVAASFDRLDQLGAVIECSDQVERLTAHYLELAAAKESCVVVSQTWDEIQRLNETIRSGLQSRGIIASEETVVATHERLDLTPAQKRDKRYYSDDSVLVFQRRVGGLRRGAIGKLWDMTDTHLLIESEGHIRAVSFSDLEGFHVCRTKELKIAAGDCLQLKANGETVTRRKLANGELVTVKAVTTDGRIRLEDGRILEHHYRTFVRGYAVTSYASQGKTVDYVLFSDSAEKAASNDQQWYVTTSRARKGIRLFTRDRLQLRENIIRSGERTLSLELAEIADERMPRRISSRLLPTISYTRTTKV